MMFQHDYRMDQYVNQRQHEIRLAARQPHQPSALRVRTGTALISLGERLRGCTQVAVTPVATRTAHHGQRALA